MQTRGEGEAFVSSFIRNRRRDSAECARLSPYSAGCTLEIPAPGEGLSRKYYWYRKDRETPPAHRFIDLRQHQAQKTEADIRQSELSRWAEVESRQTLSQTNSLVKG